MYSYWIGSTQMQQPLYQYRLILNEDDYLINVATDMDFNIEGEIKFPVIPNTSAKINLVVIYTFCNTSPNYT
jgi:hypothetical protein